MPLLRIIVDDVEKKKKNSVLFPKNLPIGNSRRTFYVQAKRQFRNYRIDRAKY